MKATMKVSDASRKLAMMVWGRSWSDKKHPVPAVEPPVPEEETAWRLRFAESAVFF